MKKGWSPILLAVILIGLLADVAATCTSFCFQHDGQWVFGKNFDWMIDDGMVVVNKRDVAKSALARDNPAEWTSKYGSITFNQYGREQPMGGLNEAGLVIENMWLAVTEYSAPDARPAVGELQWVQYQLDTAGSVEEVIASDSAVRIRVGSQPLHFLVCDSAGGCATIEFLEGKTVIHSGQSLPVSVLTNSTYEQSMSFVRSVAGDTSSGSFSAGDYSLKRFYWAADGVLDYQSDAAGSPVDYAFSILKNVSVDRTQWSVVYDAGDRRIYYRTRSNQAVKHFDFSAFDFACGTQVRIVDLSAPLTGDVTRSFGDYTYEANYDLIRSAFRGTEFLRNIPDEALQRLARYPEGLQCAN
jgi:penicillin V acylase-like amidase (Ntn superfamily)